MEFHTPVLLNETLEYLDPKPGNIFVDCTLGGAGHALALAKEVSSKSQISPGVIIGMDLDPQSLKVAQDIFDLARSSGEISARTYLINENYKNIDFVLSGMFISSVNGILADIGVSSYDLDFSGRGFTFQKEEPLDMRFNPEIADSRNCAFGDKQHNHPFNAKFVLASYSEKDLEKIFKEYGEEKFSSRIAKAIVRHRQSYEINTTHDLLAIIRSALPAPIKFKASDSARKIFQALRIEVNGELQNLQEFLPKAFGLLAKDGRLAVISFHSLEDRIVKNFFNDKARGCICPPDFPECRCGRNPEGKILTRKPVIASAEEISQNPRSKPAKLRVIQKI